MEIKCFLIMIIIVLTIYLIFCYDSSYYNSENFQNGTSLSNEAIQNITGIYNKNNMIVTNLNTTGLSTMKDATIINNLNVAGIIAGNVTGNVTGNLVGNVTGDLSGNKININNKGMVMWRQQIYGEDQVK